MIENFVSYKIFGLRDYSFSWNGRHYFYSFNVNLELGRHIDIFCNGEQIALVRWKTKPGVNLLY